MFKSAKHIILPATVFITGACVLVVEVVATRVLSPFYGNTIFTVSSVISVILAALSFGYYIGGHLADRYPTLRWFFGIILASGILVILFHILGIIALPLLGYALPLSTGPLFASMLLFFFPAFLLGTLSPYAVKLQTIDSPLQGIGSVSGNIFFWSTLGSIVGSLLAGFILIPYFGINHIMIANGIILFFVGAVPLFFLGEKKNLFKSFLILLFVICASYYVLPNVSGAVLYSKDGIYEKITVYDGKQDGRPVRFFQQDKSDSGAMFLDSSDPRDLVYGYTKYYSIYKIFNPDIKKTLVIGGGAYSIPKALLVESSEISVDVSEIEPSLYILAKEYFGLGEDPRLHNYTDDGRRFLHDSKSNYDLIFSDVYYSLFSIPAHFTTVEFFTTAKSKLNNDGIFMANMIGDLSRQKPSLIMSEIKTFQSVFPNSYFFAVDSPNGIQSQNIIFVGFNSDKQIDINSLKVKNSIDPIINSLPEKLIDMKRFDLSPYPILTDDYSPVEYLTGKVLQRLYDTDSFSGKEILATIEQLVDYGPRYPTSDGHKKTQDFIISEISGLADEVKTQDWKHSEVNGDSYDLKNIIARFNPGKTDRIILGTHYDSQKFSFRDFSNKEKPSPGANNSASGVAVLLKIANLLKNSPSLGIDIVFFDGEEGEESQGADFTNWKPLGSTYFTKHLSELYGATKPKYAIILDMVCDKNLDIPKEESSVKNAPTLSEEFWKIAQKTSGSIFKDNIHSEIQDDHTPLNMAGIPSILVIDYDYPYYATTRDTVDKCSAKSLHSVTEALWNYLDIKR